MKLLGLDVATKTGYNVLEFVGGREYLLETGIIKLKTKDCYRDRFIDLNSQLSILVAKVNPDLVVIEELHSTRNAKTTILLGMYLGVVYISIPSSIKIETVNLISARHKLLKHLGRRVTKEDVFEWVVNRYKLKDFKFKADSDITDSILISYYIAQQYNKLTD